MADDKPKTQDEKAAADAPSKSEMKSIQDDYRKASPKERRKKFAVDPITKTLRRA